MSAARRVATACAASSAAAAAAADASLGERAASSAPGRVLGSSGVPAKSYSAHSDAGEFSVTVVAV
jgi:hypothetical protein